jgi:Protein of unknown function (DUF3489)
MMLAHRGDTAMPRTPKNKTKSLFANDGTKSAQKPVPLPSLARSNTKAAAILALLKSKRGATIDELMHATGWQAHSVRGFLAGSLRKRYGQVLISAKANSDVRRYRVQ